MIGARTTYTPRPDATPETELRVLSDLYRFILFESKASKKGSPTPATPDDAKEIKSVRAKTILQEDP